jgi:hypothetical protein
MLALAPWACGGGGRDENIDLPASSTAGSGPDDTSTTAVATTGKLDVGSGQDLGGGELNCDAVDFLFVIDNSSSMAREQQRLVEAVPGFTDSILTALPGITDVRVGVVDTDSYPGLGTEDPLDGCPATEDCGSCDYTLGALLTKPSSALDPGLSCDFSTGTSYMDARNPSFADEFACVAEVGLEGNQIEQQAGALVAALSPAALAGGCNDGFLRDEALLIVLVVTDEEDDYALPPAPQGGSLGEPDEWVEAIVAAKGGLASNVVAFGLVGGDPLYGDCDELGADGQGAEASPRLMQMLEAFELSFIGSVCQDDYGEFFDDALVQVAQGCMEFQAG